MEGSGLIASGMGVYTTDGQKVGRVQHFDPTSALMVVEHGVLLHHRAHVPIALVDQVDVNAGVVYLGVNSEQLHWATKIEPEQSLYEPG